MARYHHTLIARGVALGLVALGNGPAFICTAHASDDPPADVTAKVTADAKAVGAAVKRDAKVVADAAKEGAQQVAVAAKEIARDVAAATKQGAEEVAAAAKQSAKKAKAAVKPVQAGDKPTATPDNKPAP
jgi:hypothetical protein